MDAFKKARVLARIARWFATWSRRDLEYCPGGALSPKFTSARKAATLVSDGATVFTSGMSSLHRNSIFFWAIRDRFARDGHPRGLTWITVGAQGARGRIPGSIEELDSQGLISVHIGGHLETMKSLLRSADRGHLELHTMPQGVQTRLIEAQASGEDSLVTRTGVGTFLDPRVGSGTPVLPGAKHNFVTLEGDRLRFRLPRIDVAMFVAPSADAEGNVYMRNASAWLESLEASRAARRNGGRVIVSVAEIVPKRQGEIFLRAEEVDAIVVNPRNEQVGGVPQRRPLAMFTAGANVDVVEAAEELRFINDVLGITPRRGPVDIALARLAADLFTRVARKGAIINIGVGLPEEAARLFFDCGLHHGLTFTSETGVYGGLPTPGIFFGGAINPQKFITSAEMFHLYDKQLDVGMLGLLQADSDGNVNVSRRGAKAIQYVGPGGLPDITASAKTILFIGSWMANGKLAIQDRSLRIRRAGLSKFVDRVDEITFSGKEALRQGKLVYYVTNVGVFHLTHRGMELVEVMPGVDVRRHILDGCPMRVVLPESGNVPVVPTSIVTGKGFELTWRDEPTASLRVG